MALVIRRKIQPTTPPKVESPKIEQHQPVEFIVPIIHVSSASPDKHPLLRLVEWIENEKPFWDYSRCSPFDLLPRFDPSAFTPVRLGVVLTLEPDKRISEYFKMTDEDRYKLFNGLPTTTTAEQFCKACRDYLATLGSGQ